jgi:hypothetical protein
MQHSTRIQRTWARLQVGLPRKISCPSTAFICAEIDLQPSCEASTDCCPLFRIRPVRAHEGLTAPLRVESDIQPGWNVLTVSKSLIGDAGEAQAAAQVAESYFVVLASPSFYHHHGKLVSEFDFSTLPSPRNSPATPIKSFGGVSRFEPDLFVDEPAAVRAVFEALAELANRTIVSFGDSVERNIVNDVYSICRHLKGTFGCIKMPDVAEPGRAAHISWPSLGLNWITVSFPGVSHLRIWICSKHLTKRAMSILNM